MWWATWFRVRQVALQEDLGVAEGSLGLAARRDKPLEQLFLGVGHAHAAPAAPRRRLDDDRIAMLLGKDQRVFFLLDRRVSTGNHIDACGNRCPSPGNLVPQ